MANESDEKLSIIDPTERVLLLSQCLRPSKTCPGQFDREGLICPESCGEDCVIGRLRESAFSLGYGGVCVAAGGSMALRFVKEHEPRGVVAVACAKELVEGVEGVQALAKKHGRGAPVVAVIPLSVDGCVDTAVDEAHVQRTMALGCPSHPKGS